MGQRWTWPRVMPAAARPRRRLAAGLAGLCLAAGLFAFGGRAGAIDAGARRTAVLATVQVWGLNANLEIVTRCSGAVVDPIGEILTNWHCLGVLNWESEDVSRQGRERGETFHPQGWVLIGPTRDPKQPPIPTYYARLQAGSAQLDLAVVRILRAYDDRQALPAALPLVALPPGDSTAVELGDPIHVLGYPVLGGRLITLASGEIAGWDDRDDNGVLDSFKISASLSPGYSGGPTLDDAGRQIGVNTWGREKGSKSIERSVMVSLAKPLIGAALEAPVGLTTAPTGTVTAAATLRPSATLTPAATATATATPAATAMPPVVATGPAGPPGGEPRPPTGTATATAPRGASPVAAASPGGSDGAGVATGTLVPGPTATPRPVVPAPATLRPTTVLVRGTVLDADTRRPLGGARLLILKPGVMAAIVAEAPDPDALTAAIAISGEDGLFVAAPGVAPGQQYGLLVSRAGYRSRFLATGVAVPAAASGVIELAEPVTLEKL